MFSFDILGKVRRNPLETTTPAQRHDPMTFGGWPEVIKVLYT